MLEVSFSKEIKRLNLETNFVKDRFYATYWISTIFGLCLTFFFSELENRIKCCFASETFQGSIEIASCKPLAGIPPASGNAFVGGHHRKKQNQCSYLERNIERNLS